MGNRRTESAREHDDSELIESMEEGEPTPRFEGRSGGALQDDIATQAELERVRDPEARQGANKQDDIDHGQASPTRHPADKSSGGNRSE